MTEILHVAHAAEWRAAAEGAAYAPATLAVEGFVHCCTAEQLDYVLDAHFRGEADLVLLTIDAAALTAELRWEGAPPGPFPHVYGTIDTAAVIGAATVPDER